MGTVLSMQIPFVGFAPILTSEHMGALGVFGLCQILAFAQWMRSKMSEDKFQVIFRSVLLLVGFTAATLLVVATFLQSMFLS